MTDTRKAFEAWAKSNFLNTDQKIKDAWGQDRYFPHIESMWLGWQAALAAPPKGLFVDMIAEHGLQEPQPVKQADQSCRNCTFHYKDVDMPPCNSCTLGDHVNNNWEPMSKGQRQLNKLPPEGATQ